MISIATMNDTAAMAACPDAALCQPQQHRAPTASLASRSPVPPALRERRRRLALQVNTGSRERCRIVIIGPGASGKDWLRNELHQHTGGKVDVSYTTRPPRPGEVDGKDYHFVSEQTFDTMTDQGEFFEYARFGDFCYGTSMESWRTSDFFIMSPGTINRMTESDRTSCLVVFRDPPPQLLYDRLMNRSADAIHRDTRLRLANKRRNADKCAFLNRTKVPHDVRIGEGDVDGASVSFWLWQMAKQLSFEKHSPPVQYMCPVRLQKQLANLEARLKSTTLAIHLARLDVWRSTPCDHNHGDRDNHDDKEGSTKEVGDEERAGGSGMQRQDQAQEPQVASH